MEGKLENILKRHSIQRANVEKISDDAGRMKNIFSVETKDRGELGVYLYDQPEGGERGRSIKERLNAEKYTFDKIRNETSARAPEVYATDNEKYLICDWLEGENTGFKIDRGERKHELAEMLGQALSEIHSIKYREFGEINREGIENFKNTWKEFIEYMIKFLKGFEKPEIAEKGISYLEDNLQIIEGNFDPVLIHGDFHAWNTVVDEDDSLGILDCEASFVGCREYELTRAMGHWTEEYSISESFIQAYGKNRLKGDWRSRQDYYEVLHATVGLIDGIRMGSEELVRMNREGLEKQLD